MKCVIILVVFVGLTHSLLEATTFIVSNSPVTEEAAELGIVLKSSGITNTTVSPSKPYFGDFFFAVGDVYRPMHGYVSVIFCSTGMIFNTFIVVVLNK